MMRAWPRDRVSAIVETGRRAGMALYHAAVDLNYRFEAVAAPTATAAGEIRTYELANTHGEDVMLRALADTAADDAVVYDVGAYAGEYTLALAAGKPDRTLVAFEPNPRGRGRLRANLAATAPAGEVRVEPVALGAETTRRTFYRSSFPKLSSFERADATRWGARVAATPVVAVRRLDDIVSDLPPPDHLKIDVEGHEPGVLAGAAETIERHRPSLYVEVHDRSETDRGEQVRDFCRSHGYTVDERERALLCHPGQTDETAGISRQ